jgi:ATP-dependent Lon protease
MNDQPILVSADATATTERPARPAASTRAVPDDALIILPARNVVMFPGLGSDGSGAAPRTAVQEALRLEAVGVLLQTGRIDGPDELLGRHHAGVLRYITTPTAFITRRQGQQRFRVLGYHGFVPVARVQLLDQADERSRDPGDAPRP